MGGTGEWLQELALEAEHRAMEGTGGHRELAALVLSVAAARIVGDAGPGERGKVRRKAEDGWRSTLTEYGLREEGAGRAALASSERAILSGAPACIDCGMDRPVAGSRRCAPCAKGYGEVL